MNSEKLLESLKKVNYPGFSRDIVSFGLVNEAKFDNGKALVKIELTSTDPKLPLHLKSQIEEVLGQNEEITETDIAIAVKKDASSSSSDAEENRISGILSSRREYTIVRIFFFLLIKIVYEGF